MSLTSVVEVLKKYFDWTDEDIARKEKELSFICYLKEKDILEKANFYTTTFGLTQPEFIKMLKTLPTVLSLKNDSVLDKVNFYTKTFELTQSEFNKML